MNGILNWLVKRSEEIEKTASFSFLVILLLKCGFFNTAAYPVFHQNSILLTAILLLHLGAVLAVRKYSKKEMLLTAVFLVLCAVQIFVTKETFLPLTLCATLVFKNQNIDSLLKWFIGIRSVMFTVVFAMAALGFAENRRHLLPKAAGVTVQAFDYGTAHPNQVGLFYAVIVFACLCVMEKKNYNLKLLLIALGAAFVYAVVNTRTMLITVAVMLAGAFLLQFERAEKMVAVLLEKLSVIAAAAILVIGFTGTFLYTIDSPALHSVLDPVNRIFNNRLSLPVRLLDNGMKLSLFGSREKLEVYSNNRPIDNSYFHILMRYGIVLSAMTAAVYTYACRYFARRKPIYSLCILTVMLYAMFECILHLPGCNLPMIISAGALMKWWDEPRTLSLGRLSERLSKGGAK